MTRGLVAASFLALGLGSLCAEPLSRAEAVSAALAANPGVRRSRTGVEQARASDLPRNEPVPAPVRSARTTVNQAHPPYLTASAAGTIFNRTFD